MPAPDLTMIACVLRHRPDFAPLRWAAVLILAVLAGAVTSAGAAEPQLGRFLDRVEAGALVPGADHFGPVREDLPVVPALRGDERLGWVFLNSDLAGAVGYSGKPIHVMVGIDDQARITGAKLVKHYEPIVLVGIPEARVAAVIEGYAGLDVTAETGPEAEGHEVDIISGATVTIMVIDDSIVRASLRVARALGLGGLAREIRPSGPLLVVDPDIDRVEDWATLLGEGSVRRLSLDLAMVNDAFARSGNAKAAARPESGAGDVTFIDLYTGVATIPSIGRSVLGEAEYANLTQRLEDGQHAIFVGGRGRYSFKGSGYVRGGIFDRILLVQGDRSVRFRDRSHKRLGQIAARGAPDLQELDLFVIPADAGFDPAQPWRLQLLVQRAIGATERAYLTFDLDYVPPARYLRTEAVPEAAVPVAEAAAETGRSLWQRIWQGRLVDVTILVAAIGLLTIVFFFQTLLIGHERGVFWFRIAFLVFTVGWLGWYGQAQLSVVNVMTFANAILSGFSWDHFLMDPLVFILWSSVAAALIFWGRGAYCGWLCPFGALQELLNRLAKLVRIPQWQVPWALHERLWPLKYILFLALFGLSLHSLDLAERAAEVEPFKTAIILKFMREWPFVLFALALLAIGLFVERFYCRYLCPLGAALAIPGRLRTFDWLKRYRECGSPCQRCANECMVQAIHPEGHINPNECLYCLHCQVLYVDDHKCPVCIQQRLKRERRQAMSGDSARPAIRRPERAAAE